MAESTRGVSTLERIEALLANPELYELGELVPEADLSAGGRPRMYPGFMFVLYEALISVYGSARQVEAEIAHPRTWSFIRRQVRRRQHIRLPLAPMRRHHYLYARNRYLQQPEVLKGLGTLHRNSAARQAREIGLLDPDGPGSFTHPNRDRLVYGDGKVVTPLYRAQPGDTTVDRQTGEIRPLRTEPDASLHFEGTGETAWGTKFVMVAARGEERHARILLDVDFVPKPGGEARTALDCINRLAPEIPGAQAVVYDTAFRGVHHQYLMRELGLLPINRVTAAKAGAKKPRRADKRVEKTVHVEDKTVTSPTARPRRFSSSPRVAPSVSDGSPKPVTSSSSNCGASVRNAPGTRVASTAGTTTTSCLTSTEAPRSRSASTAPTRTPPGSSTAPRTSGRSHRRTPTSANCSDGATTPSPSTGPLTTPCSSDGPTASDTGASS